MFSNLNTTCERRHAMFMVNEDILTMCMFSIGWDIHHKMQFTSKHEVYVLSNVRVVEILFTNTQLLFFKQFYRIPNDFYNLTHCGTFKRKMLQ